jgi:hypothetical protein
LSARFQHIAAATGDLVQSSLPLWGGTLPTPVHGDLARHHTLIERGQALFLDWEMFGLGDPALDVARLLQREAQSLTAEQVEAWLERYLQFVDQPAMAERIDIFQRLLEIHNVIYLLVGLQQRLSCKFLSAQPWIALRLRCGCRRSQILILSWRTLSGGYLKPPLSPDERSQIQRTFSVLERRRVIAIDFCWRNP